VDINFIILAVITAASYFTLAFSGFGTVVITLTLGAHFYAIKTLLPVLVPLTVLANLYILVRHYQYVDKKTLFRQIVPFMGLGLLAGIFVFNFFHGDLLKVILGVLVVLLSIHELAKFFKTDSPGQPLSRIQSMATLISAGIVQGMYASGGPLLVYAINRLNLSKSVFRSTLSAVWLIMNTVLTASYLVSAKLTVETCQFSMMLLPSMVLGLAVGEFLHRRIDEKAFRFCVSLLLLFAGMSVIIK